MKRLYTPLAAAASLALAACGSSSSTPAPVSFPRPQGYIAAGITVDDTANKVFANNELGWQSSMKSFSEVNRIIAYDVTWGGPYANLYDDGPWTQGGHEPELCPITGNPTNPCVAGDHKLGAIVFIKPPTAAEGNLVFGYGMRDNVYQTNLGNGWIWPSGPNGSFQVSVGQTQDVTGQGLKLAAHGNVQMKVTIDMGQLTPPTSGAWLTNAVGIKGTFSSWGTVDLTPTAAGNVYSFDLATLIGPGKPLLHSGLLNECDKPEWVWVFGGTGQEYKVSGAAAAGGVKAYTRTSSTAAWAEQTVANNPDNKNTYIQVPKASGTCP